MNKGLLSEKNAIITGGNAGIGKAIAKVFALQGANVAILGTSYEKGSLAVQEIREATQGNAKVEFFQVDVSKKDQVEKSVESIEQLFGKIDILVNNAGIVRDNLLMKMSEEDWDLVMNVNLKSVYNLTHSLIRSFIKAKKGKIINVSSVVGLTGNPGQSNYAASKAGMIGFTKSLAKEVAQRGITVNCIAPGFIDTAMTESLTETQKTAILGQIPMNRLGLSEEIAQAALFLASEYANYITGQVLAVDGGMTMM